MKRILVLGAGKSATALIDYLIEQAPTHNWTVVLADRNINRVIQKIEGRPNAEALELDIMNAERRGQEVEQADFAISLLPPILHIHVAKDCIRFKTSLVTASYVSDEVLALDAAAREAGILLMNEMGADPGIDHMSAMELIDQIRAEGGHVTSFQSYCGGLIAPESDDNPWHYKISWNPWNIVRAGASGATFLMNEETYYRTYENLYKECSEVEVDGYGTLAAYANRDSLKYQKSYELDQAHTILRATLRHPKFVKGWATMIDLGLTDDQNEFVVTNMTFQQWFAQATKKVKGETLTDKLKTLDVDQEVMAMFDYLQLDRSEIIGLEGAQPPARILQKVLEEKWNLSDEDKDLLVFHHDIEYEVDGDSRQLESSLLVKGDNQVDTAMAKCVGLPMAIFTKIFLTQGFENLEGVQIPTMKEVYQPVLKELADLGVQFIEK